MASITQQLREQLGGAWRYDRMRGHWLCDDQYRSVVRIHTGGVDVNGEAAPGFGYFLRDSRQSEDQRIWIRDAASAGTAGNAGNAMGR